MNIELQVLGGVEVLVDGQPVDVGHARQRCVLAVLAVAANRTVSLDQLVERVWAERAPARARDTAHNYLSRLRRALAGAEGVAIVRRTGGYRLTLDERSVDLHLFRHLVATARETSDDSLALDLYERALGLWRGEPFTGLDTPWLAGVRLQLAAERTTVRSEHIDRALRAGRHASVLATLRSWVTHNPLDENLTGQLMLALYRSGRQAEALKAFRDLRAALAAELGVDPAHPLERLHQRMLTGDPVLTAPPAPDLGGGSVPRRGPSPTVPGARGPAALPTPAELPADTRHLVGRSVALAELDGSLLDTRGRPSVLHVRGMAGVGKTALVVHWSHRIAGRFPDGQLFVDLCGHALVPPRESGDVLTHFLVALGVPLNQIPFQAVDRAGLYRSTLAGKRVLIVLDNAVSAEQVRPLLPGSASCAVVITSRNELDGLIVSHDAHPVTLDVLSDADARHLLTVALGHHHLTAEPAAMAILARLCGNLPLALRIVAAHLTGRDNRVRPLIDRLSRDGRLDVLQIANDPHLAVRTALDLSYQTLDPPARQLFRRCGLAPGDLDEHVAAALLDVPPAEAALVLDRLAQAHLIQRDNAGRYRVHDLVREHAAELCDTEETDDERLAALGRVLAWYLRTADQADRTLAPYRPRLDLPPDTPTSPPPLEFAGHDGALAWCVAEQGTLATATRLAARHGLHHLAWRIPAALHQFSLLCQGRPEVSACFRMGLDSARQAGDHPGIAAMLYGLGLALEQTTRLTDAAAHYQQALEHFRAGTIRWGEAVVLNSLGTVSRKLGRLDAAVDCFRRSSAVFTELDIRWGVGLNLYSQAEAHRQDGKIDEALRCYRESVVISRESGSAWGEAVGLVRIADTYHQDGRVADALTHYERALTVGGDTGDQAGKAVVLTQCGRMAKELGRDRDSADYWTRAVAIFDELGDERAAEIRTLLGSSDAAPDT
ncbi:AfsR/SARP family transcriptional regulator [Actinocrispum wychmicini]|uniref:DNA-binding SARP family transcriptional activator n=1 Tax=Actinocrispum wychmicini TaxID=1213861 RepID=A0A4R2JBC2_9PSEU|nr:BTAD domain-containing putative transcriptional regulator [Actinocrispum wychmicini]TCO55667.1 DNA-binding SARP family transcriptional activator [Actinocrispum wychmicini]